MSFINVLLLLALHMTTWVPVETNTLLDSPLYSSKDKTPHPEGEEDETEELAARSS